MTKKTQRSEILSLEHRIVEIRGRRVMLDSDLASVYGISTGRFNEAVKRNKDRFPVDFAFQLTATEFDDLISQSAISSLKNRSTHGGRRLTIEGLMSRTERPRFPDLSLGRSTFKQAQREAKEVKQEGLF
jgi:hypothetical protein